MRHLTSTSLLAMTSRGNSKRRCDCRTQCAGWERSARRGGGAGGCRGPRRSGRERGSRGGDRRRRISFEEKLSHDLVLHPNEDLHFIGAGQPLGGRRFPFYKIVAAREVSPGLGFIMNKLSIPVPKRRPLYARDH